MNLDEMDKDLNAMILQGKAMDAFEKYYADDVVMVENFDAPCVGKDANRKREQEFFGGIAEFHGASVGKRAVGEDSSFGEWVFECTFKNGARVTLKQVAVRQWKNGKVVHERFYYKPQM